MNIAEVVIRVVELFEAEGRSLRRNVMRTALAVAGLGALAVLMFGGVGLLIASLYLRLRSVSSDTMAALLTGLSCLLVAIIGAYGAWKWLDHED